MDGPVAFDTITDGNPVAVAVVANKVPAQATQTPRAVRIQLLLQSERMMPYRVELAVWFAEYEPIKRGVIRICVTVLALPQEMGTA